MTVYRWSQIAANNATADSSINWAEGQAPSSVNDSARGMMAALSKYRDDIAGSIVTTGTSTAYAVASNEVFDTLAHLHNQQIAFVPNVTSGSPVTLNVDGLGAKPLRSSPGVELPVGTLSQGTPYLATYNNTDGAFYLMQFFSAASQVPIGAMLPYTGTTAPSSNWVLPFGQAISRTTYAQLFALNGTTFGPGDGSTTFNVVDMRGRAPFGQDNMGGSAASRITVAGSFVDGTVRGNAGGGQNVTLGSVNLPNYALSVTLSSVAGSVSGQYERYKPGAEFSTSNAGAAGSAVTVFSSVGSTTFQSVFSTAFSFNSGSGTTASINGGVTQVPTVVLPPMIIVPWILRVL